MEERMIFAGAGGQGLMTLGKVLVQAGMSEGKNVTWYPSYGAEVRGGTAHCHVVVKDGEIYSPLVEKATTLVIMNEPSCVRFSPRLSDGGLLVLNTSLVPMPEGSNGSILALNATDIANELDDIRVANVVMLGALNAARSIVGEKTIRKTLESFLGAKRRDMLDLNLRAYDRGREAAAKAGPGS
jgi:2-oxoglutarate ferredoxin oxidoreductase subunit gamma